MTFSENYSGGIRVKKAPLSFRTMQKHMKQLSDWLREEEVKGHSSEDEDILNAKQEVQEVSCVAPEKFASDV